MEHSYIIQATPGREFAGESHPPHARLKEQIECLRDCANALSKLAYELEPDAETITIIANNLRVTADYAANLLALHNAKKFRDSQSSSS